MATDQTESPVSRVSHLLDKLPSPLALISYLCLAAIAFVAGWALIVEDPLGGQPMARLALNEPAAPLNQQQATDIRREETPTEAPADPQTSNEPESAAGGAKIITLDSSNEQPQIFAELIEESRYGKLPKIAENGNMAINAYRTPPPPLDRNTPRISIVVGGLGLSAAGTEDAIKRLPGEVALAFAPYGRDLNRLTALARQARHEIMLQLPMEPFDYPDNDPGPHTLLTGLSKRQNISRLHWLLARFSGYIGVSSYQGAQFMTKPEYLEPVLSELRNRGVGYFDDGATARNNSTTIASRLGLANARADIVIDADLDPVAIEAALKELENIAKNRGTAVGSASALPVSIARIEDWAKALPAKGIALVPLSSTMREMR